MITSVSNTRVQWVRGLQRKRRARQEEGVFVVEGVRLSEETLRAEMTPALVFHGPDPDRRAASLIEAFARRGAPTQLVSPRVLQACSSTRSAQGLLLVVPVPRLQAPADLRLAVVADGVADPGNLGALLRTSLAAGVDLVLLTSGTVDPYNPKVVRAAMGAHFHLPIVAEAPIAARRRLSGLEVWVAEPRKGQSIYQLDARRPLALVIGAEARGPTADWRSPESVRVTIPMEAAAESLNTAAAAAVLLFEIRRQRGTS